MSMEVDNDSNCEESQQSLSLLNTEYNQLIGDKDGNSCDSDDYGLVKVKVRQNEVSQAFLVLFFFGIVLLQHYKSH